MELDIGATAIAGRNIPVLIKEKYPGRFPVWDMNDAFGIKNADANPGTHPEPAQGLHTRFPLGSEKRSFRHVLPAEGGPQAGLKYADKVNQGRCS